MTYKQLSFWYCLFIIENKQVIYLPEYDLEKKCDKFLSTEEINNIARIMFMKVIGTQGQFMNVPTMLAKSKRYLRMRGGKESDFITYELIDLTMEV